MSDTGARSAAGGGMTPTDVGIILGSVGGLIAAVAGPVAAIAIFIIRPYREALEKADRRDAANALLVTHLQAIIDELVEAQAECEIAHSDKDAWISTAHSCIISASGWIRSHGAEIPDIGEPPPKRERKALVRARYLQNISVQNAANVAAAAQEPAK